MKTKINIRRTWIITFEKWELLTHIRIFLMNWIIEDALAALLGAGRERQFVAHILTQYLMAFCKRIALVMPCAVQVNVAIYCKWNCLNLDIESIEMLLKKIFALSRQVKTRPKIKIIVRLTFQASAIRKVDFVDNPFFRTNFSVSIAWRI